MDVWFGLVAPAGTPKPIIDKLHDAFAAAIQSPAIVKHMSDLGVEAITDTPSEFAALIGADGERMNAVIRAAGIKPH
jgi:tripartite-type tricarboxylate transporter receptor subunit TctC